MFEVIDLFILYVASLAGLLTVLLYFLAFVLYALTLHPEDAECGGISSGTYLGEHLVMEEDVFLSVALFKVMIVLYLKSACLHSFAGPSVSGG